MVNCCSGLPQVTPVREIPCYYVVLKIKSPLNALEKTGAAAGNNRMLAASNNLPC
jgi:hypothetical protein